MINFTNVCPHCGTEWWDKHECEGTRRADKEKADLARALEFEAERVEAERVEAERVVAERVAALEKLLNRESRLEKNSKIMSYHDYVMTDAVNLTIDPVNNPKHYTSHPSGVECIDITKHYNFQIGNAMKYLWRQGLKNDSGMSDVEKQIEDCKKAIWYINSFIDDLKG